jgi:hypothetical protein
LPQNAKIRWPYRIYIVPPIIGVIYFLFFDFDQWHFIVTIIPLVYLSILMIYASKAFFIKTELFYQQLEHKNIVFEFEYIKTLLFIYVPVMIIFLVNNIFFHEQHIEKYLVLFAAAAEGALFRYMSLIAGRDSRFYFAKKWSGVILESKDYLEKMKYLRLLLASYNRFLKRRLRVGLDDTKIYSIILYKNDEERSEIIKTICKKLEGDKLDLAKYLSSIYGVPDSEFYTQETFLQRLKPIGIILATSIPILVSVVQLFMK